MQQQPLSQMIRSEWHKAEAYYVRDHGSENKGNESEGCAYEVRWVRPIVMYPRQDTPDRVLNNLSQSIMPYTLHPLLMLT